MSSKTHSRKYWVGGNWKCNGSLSSIAALSEALNPSPFPFTKDDLDVVVFPTALHVHAAVEKLPGAYNVGCQDCCVAAKGAFTGDISADMIKDFGLNWLIVGHSECRAKRGDSDEKVAEKVKRAMEAGLNVTACIGETLEQQQAGKALEICYQQLKAIANSVTDWNRIVIAYEPVWAIGTGKVATPEYAQTKHMEIRTWISDNVTKEIADNLRIVYGGSVTPSNCETLMQQPDVDGFLVGGASLNAGFVDIIKSALVA
uniref:Triosephosphate isomerase n=1 Tax=Nephromyces sp. MMRI TaxID=2496275 RepID=A0A3Q8UBK2_9APIC|nr:triosephosphate isomerase [Nephromyces sp. MMRI]AZL94311.1 triosephosphate isomerase [Nephromyces sp. MMRI]AZL94312.1 triosephosphate isomerase [Nephromyces sp. MMRI]